jgi:hypothetical protein
VQHDEKRNLLIPLETVWYVYHRSIEIAARRSRGTAIDSRTTASWHGSTIGGARRDGRFFRCSLARRPAFSLAREEETRENERSAHGPRTQGSR